MLSAIAAMEPGARRVAGLRTCAGIPLLVCSWAVGRDLGGQAPTDVAAVLAQNLPGPLLVDDSDDADPATMDVIVALAGALPLLVAARRAPRGGPVPVLVARLADAGAAIVALGPLGPDDAEGLAGELGAVDPRAVARRSGGVPGLLVPLARGAPPPEHLLAAVDAALAGLSSPAREDLAVAGLVAHALALHDLPAGEELEEAHLLARENGQWAVRHGLAAERVLAGPEPGDPRATYRRAAGLARDPVRAVELLEAAGDQAAAVAAARAAAAAAPDPGRRARLWGLVAGATGDPAAGLEAATAAVWAADGPTAARHAAAAGRDAGARGGGADAGPEVRAWVALRAAQAARLAGDESTALAGVRALDGVHPKALRDEARLEGARLGVCTEWRSPPQTGARPGPGGALVAGLAAALEGSPDAPAALVESVAAAEAALNRDVELAARAAHVVVLASRGESELARAALKALEQRVVETGARSWRDAPARLGAALAFHLSGDPRPLLDLGAAGDPLGPPLTAHLAVALADVGRTGEAAALVDVAQWPDLPVAQALRWWAAAETAFSAGRLRTAVIAAGRCADSAPPSFPPVAGAALLSAWAAVESGAALPPLDLSAPLPLGAHTEHEALRLMAAGDVPGAASLFDDAASSWGRGHQRAAFRCRWSAADLRVRSEEDTHRHTAVEQLRRLDGVATDLGLRPLVARVRRSLRSAGVRLAAEVAPAGAGPLSPRESEVLRLVGEGRSSSEIAAQLGVAPSTVETQIKSAIRKLGATNRRQAAAMAAEVERP